MPGSKQSKTTVSHSVEDGETLRKGAEAAGVSVSEYIRGLIRADGQVAEKGKVEKGKPGNPGPAVPTMEEELGDFLQAAEAVMQESVKAAIIDPLSEVVGQLQEVRKGLQTIAGHLMNANPRPIQCPDCRSPVRFLGNKDPNWRKWMDKGVIFVCTRCEIPLDSSGRRVS